MNKLSPCPIVVLIGGNGSNLQALIDAQEQSAYRIVGVISHRPDVYGLQRAITHHIPTITVDHRHYANREEFDMALSEAIQTFSPRLVVMAGFMRILSAAFIQKFSGSLLNIHPSLLPKFKGLNTHQRVLDAKESQHGVSVHFVTQELDGGPIIAQVAIALVGNEDAESLANKLHQLEHWLYPQVVHWFAQNRLKCVGNVVTLDNEPIASQGLQLVFPRVQGIIS